MHNEAIKLELGVAFNNAAQNDAIHPIRARTGEVLPPGYSCSVANLLLCNNVLNTHEPRNNQGYNGKPSAPFVDSLLCWWAAIKQHAKVVD